MDRAFTWLIQSTRTKLFALAFFVWAIFGFFAFPSLDFGHVHAQLVTSQDVTVKEEDGKAIFTFTGTQLIDGRATIRYSTFDGTASSILDIDFTETKGSFTIAAGGIEIVEVPITDDLVPEGTEQFTISVLNSDNNPTDTWTATILDADKPSPTPTPTPIPPTPGPGPTATPGPGPTATPGPAPTSSVPTKIPTKVPPKVFIPFATVAPTEEPEPTVQPEPTTVPKVEGEMVDTTSRRSAFVRAVLAPNEIPWDLKYILPSLAIAGLLILLILFPSEIFNATVQSNYDEIINWFWIHKLQQFFKKVQEAPHLLMVVIYAILSALINSLLSPDFGFNRPTLALVLGMLVALALGALIYDVSRGIFMKRKFGHDSKLRAHSFGILTGALLVLTSRLANFLPGYCYGLFTGLVFRTNPKDKHDGRGLAQSAVLLILVGLVMWFAWIPVKAEATSGEPSLLVLVTDAAMASFWVSMLTATVFGLLPMQFLYGEQVKKWNGKAWFVIYSTGVFLFVYTLLNPAVGIYGKSDKTSWLAVLSLFLAFGAGSMLFWGYFRYRHLWGGGPKKVTKKRRK